MLTVVRQLGPLSLVEDNRGFALIGRDLLCHKEPAQGMQSGSILFLLLVLYGIRIGGLYGRKESIRGALVDPFCGWKPPLLMT